MIVVATTLAPFVMDQEDTWQSWLRTFGEMQRRCKAAGHDLRLFAALQIDARGLEPFQPLLDLMSQLDHESQFWTYQLDDGRTAVTTKNRLRHITTGQNLCVDFAISERATHLLFMAADCMPNEDLMSLVELKEFIVGGHVSTYCLDGPVDTKYVSWLRERGWRGDEVRCHMPTAAYVLVDCRLFEDGLRWRWSWEHGTDDPCMYRDAVEIHGVQPVVHHGIEGRHFPESIGAIETRGHDMRVHR